MKFLFQKRVLIIVTVVVLFGTLLSVLYQSFFVDSRDKRIHRAIIDSYIVKYATSVSDTICDITKEHEFTIYVFCGYESGCYFGLEKSSEDLENKLNSFIRMGETILKKQPEDSVVRFINKSDTLTIVYKIDREIGVLENGMISR